MYIPKCEVLRIHIGINGSAVKLKDTAKKKIEDFLLN